jgi:hypothetical protein
MQHFFSCGPLGRAGHGLRTAALLAAAASAAHAQTPAATFGPGATFSTGANSQPVAIAAADVNGDGKLDLVTANFFTAAVGVLLGTGTGTFGAATSFSTGPTNNPRYLAVADVNGDGKPDALTANAYTNTAGVLLGTGTGTFGAAATFATGGSQPGGIAVADVNNDGNPDLLLSNYASNTVGVLLNTGTGSFGTSTTYSTGVASAPRGIAVADVNGDGKPDLLVANSGTDAVGILLGTGTGAFGAPTTYSTGVNTRPHTVAVADVSGDGILDLLLANSTNTVVVLLGNGNGTFRQNTTYFLGPNNQPQPADIVAADVNGDGLPDLLTANAGNTLSVFLGTGAGAFGAPTSLNSPGGGAFDLAVADVNSDGRPDLLTAYTNGSAAGVLLNTTGLASTLVAISPASRAVGTSVTLTGTNLTGATAVSFNGTAATTFAVVNGTSITATVPVGATSGPVTVTTPSGITNGVPFVVAAPDLVISTAGQLIPAGTYNSITINYPGTGTLAGPVTVGGSVLVRSYATLNDGCFIISGAGSFALEANATLGICAAQGISSSGATGAVQTTGTRSFSPEANYVYNGTVAQATGSGLPAQVRSLSTLNPAPLTLGAPLSVDYALTVGAAGDLVTAGNPLTLLSNYGGTALVVNSGTGVVSGAATVQRAIYPSPNSGIGYRHYSAPVLNSTVADLVPTATIGSISTAITFAPVLNPTYNTSLTPTAETPFPNVYGYDERRVLLTNNLAGFDKGFFSPTSLADPLVPGRGYAVNIAANHLVDFVGTLTNGDLPVPLTSTRPTNPDGGWALLGNPYPAPLNYALVDPADRAGLEGAIYVYSSTSQYGGQYRSYVNGIGTSVLPIGQGFFARVATGLSTATLTFRNSQRLTTPVSTNFLRPATDPRPQVQLALSGAGLRDELVAYAEAGATPAFDAAFDATKLPNSTGLNLSSTATSGESLAIDARPAFTTATTLPLAIGVPAPGSYALSAADLANLPAGLDAFLADDLAGQVVKLSPGTSYSFSVSASQAAALITGRFRLFFRPATALATTASLPAESVSVYPNPARERFTVVLPGLAQASTVRAELLNGLGQVVRRQTAALPATGTQLTIEAAGLAAGVYTLRLQAGTTSLAKRLVVQ